MPDDQPLSEVVIPPPEPPQPAAEKPKKKARKRSKNTVRQRRWDRIKSGGKIAVAILAGIPSAVMAAWVLVSLLVLTFHRHSLDLDTIGVPETLSKAGFTSEVATQHLRDAIYAVRQQAQTHMALTGVDTDWELSEITIPKAGLSLQSVAVAVRSLLPGWRHEVSGEFVQSGNGISLRLRLNGRVIFSETARDDDPDAADENMPSAVNWKRLTGETDSDNTQAEVFFASALYIDGMIGYLTAADPEADRTNVVPSGPDDGVLRTITLKGPLAATRGDHTQAETFYNKVRRLAIARNNLGNAYYAQHNLEMAIAEYQAAIRLDPKLALPHSNLGNVYRDQNEPETAIAEYQAAIQLMTARRLVPCWSRLRARLRRLPATAPMIGMMSTVRSVSVIRMRRSLCRHVRARCQAQRQRPRRPSATGTCS